MLSVGRVFPERGSLVLISETDTDQLHTGTSTLIEQAWERGFAHGEVYKTRLYQNKLIFNDCSEKHTK